MSNLGKIYGETQGCRYNERNVQCDTRNRCASCGWNPEVWAKRKAALALRTPEAAEQNVDDIRLMDIVPEPERKSKG